MRSSGKFSGNFSGKFSGSDWIEALVLRKRVFCAACCSMLRKWEEFILLLDSVAILHPQKWQVANRRGLRWWHWLGTTLDMEKNCYWTLPITRWGLSNKKLLLLWECDVEKKGIVTYRCEGEDADESQLHHLETNVLSMTQKVIIQRSGKLQLGGISLPEQQLHSVQWPLSWRFW